MKKSTKAHDTVHSSIDSEPFHAGGISNRTESGYIKYHKQNISSHDDNIGDKDDDFSAIKFCKESMPFWMFC